MHKSQTDVVAEAKSSGLVKTAARGLAGFRAFALFLVLFLATSSFAVDFNVLTEGISAEITSMIAALGPVATSMIGLALFIGLAMLIKNFARRPG